MRARRLRNDYLEIDPATFTEPAIHESQHLALGETIERFVCAPDL